jgi:D-alanyl-D-alanine carboxypeptidase (penicillin-binding protein 5/6)
VIARAALANEALGAIVAKSSATVAGRALISTNELLGTYAGADGVKTGTTDEAGECLVASVSRGGRRTLLVELGSRERFVDARKLFDHVASAYAWQDVVLPDSALGWLTAGDGTTYRLRSEATSAIFVPAWQRALLLPIVHIAPGAVLTTTAPIGELRWLLGGETVAAVPLTVWQGP